MDPSPRAHLSAQICLEGQTGENRAAEGPQSLCTDSTFFFLSILQERIFSHVKTSGTRITCSLCRSLWGRFMFDFKRGSLASHSHVAFKGLYQLQSDFLKCKAQRREINERWNAFLRINVLCLQDLSYSQQRRVFTCFSRKQKKRQLKHHGCAWEMEMRSSRPTLLSLVWSDEAFIVSSLDCSYSISQWDTTDDHFLLE